MEKSNVPTPISRCSLWWWGILVLLKMVVTMACIERCLRIHRKLDVSEISYGVVDGSLFYYPTGSPRDFMELSEDVPNVIRARECFSTSDECASDRDGILVQKSLFGKNRTFTQSYFEISSPRDADTIDIRHIFI